MTVLAWEENATTVSGAVPAMALGLRESDIPVAEQYMAAIAPELRRVNVADKRIINANPTVSARTRNWLFLPGFIFNNLSTIPSEHSW